MEKLKRNDEATEKMIDGMLRSVVKLIEEGDEDKVKEGVELAAEFLRESCQRCMVARRR